jgi:hypothetical protein
MNLINRQNDDDEDDEDESTATDDDDTSMEESASQSEKLIDIITRVTKSDAEGCDYYHQCHITVHPGGLGCTRGRRRKGNNRSFENN